MAHRVVSGVLASAVADGGTFTVTYPTGYQEGDFIHGHDHRLWIMQTEFKVGQNGGFTISFGDTTATVTWNGATTIPSGTAFYLQLDQGGFSHPVDPAALPAHATPLHAVFVNLGSPVAGSSSGIFTSQTVATTTDAVLNGPLLGDITSGRMVLDKPRTLVGSWTTTAIATIDGLDEFGKVMRETSASGTTHAGTKAFKEITSIQFNVQVTAAFFGTANIFGLPVFLRDRDMIGDEYQNNVKVGTHPGDKVRLDWRLD